MRIHRHKYNKPKSLAQEYKFNEGITAESLRVIDENGTALGVLKLADALRIAQEKMLDLVEVSPLANPPVAKILNYGQFRYQKEKEARKQKAASREIETKGIRLSPRIGDHDFNVRLEQGRKFLERGDKLKLEIVLRGREKAHSDVGKEIINDYVTKIRAHFPIKVEQGVTYQAGRLTTIVARE